MGLTFFAIFVLVEFERENNCVVYPLLFDCQSLVTILC